MKHPVAALAVLVLAGCAGAPAYPDAEANMSAIQAAFHDIYGWPVRPNPALQYVDEKACDWGCCLRPVAGGGDWRGCGVIKLAAECAPPNPASGGALCQRALAHEIAHHMAGPDEPLARQAACKWRLC